MGKISEKDLRWRRKQRRGAIMSSAEFHNIEKGASGANNPSKVAGHIYWERVKKHQKGPKEKK